MSEPHGPPAEEGFNAHVGMVERAAKDGSAIVSLEAKAHHLNPAGTVHGGAIATLIDLAMGRAVASLFRGDERPVTIEVKINFLEAGRLGTLTAEANVSRRGRRFMVVRAEVTQNDDGETIAEAMGTFTSA